ncbi:hypothetical protein MBLNU230_g4121t1 [Neophaeotheca triangularis]
MSAISSRSASPDPLTLPSSPLLPHNAAARSTTPRRSRPLSQKSTNIRSSPSKSFVMEANAPEGEASPWRIKVTVEASSPSRATRNETSTKVPLQITDEQGSPVKKGRIRKPTPAKKSIEAPDENVRAQRKRKGTPIRPRRRGQPPAQESVAENESSADADDATALKPPPRSSAPRSSTTPRKRGFTPLKRPRSKRLSQARDELDEALRDAVGDETQDQEDADDVTVTENEDFTMVSIESLQSYKSKMASRKNTADQSAVGVSYVGGSSPPRAQYPDLTQQLEEATQASPAATYDAMSWKPTGPARPVSPPKRSSPMPEDPEPSEWQREREAVSQQVRNANTSRVIVINDSSNIHIHSPSPDRNRRSSPSNEDIWAEEASRSLEEEQAHDLSQAPQEQEHSEQLEDLFADQPLRPLRSKIPRTWRRSSGNDFAYSDSPAHPAVDDERRKTSGSETGESRRSSGVLTPPSTDDEVRKQAVDGVGKEVEEDGSSELTEPDGAATQLQSQATGADEQAADEQQDEADGSSGSDSSDNVTSPDGDDTGMFWQSNMPQVYRRRERPPVRKDPGPNLSELLGPETSGIDATTTSKPVSNSPRKPVVYRSSRAAEFRQRQQANALRTKAAEGKVRSSPAKHKPMSSPLRKSLLKSSKVRDSPMSKALDQSAEETQDMVDSFQSKASDQRQLLAEAQASVKRPRSTTVEFSYAEEQTSTNLGQSEASYVDNEEEAMHQQPEGESDYVTTDDEVVQEPSRSYEEHLNLDSPQKIRVKFNDSLSQGHDSQGNSTLLLPKKNHPPLFGSAQPTASTYQESPKSPQTITLVSKKAPRLPTTNPPPAPTFLTKLSGTFWTAITNTSSQPSQTPSPLPFPSNLRSHLRSRYGILSQTHPWTLAHMRTLHRMLKSCTSGKPDSIIPNPLTAWQTLPPMAPQLAAIVGTEQAVRNGKGGYTFTEEHAYVVASFMAVLVEGGVVEAMERGEIAFLGDGMARALRGVYGAAGRDGGEVVWQGGWGGPKDGSLVGWEFVVGALGACVREEERIRRTAAERGPGEGEGL